MCEFPEPEESEPTTVTTTTLSTTTTITSTVEATESSTDHETSTIPETSDFFLIEDDLVIDVNFYSSNKFTRYNGCTSGEY